MTRAETDDPVPLRATWMRALRCAGTARRRAAARAPIPLLSQLPQASPERDTQEVALPRAADRREHPFLSNELWASPDKDVGAAIEASCTLSRRFSPLCSPSIRTAFTFAGLRTSRGLVRAEVYPGTLVFHSKVAVLDAAQGKLWGVGSASPRLAAIQPDWKGVLKSNRSGQSIRHQR